MPRVGLRRAELEEEDPGGPQRLRGDLGLAVG